MAKVLVVVAKFNELITKALLEGAKDQFEEAGFSQSQVDITWVPGTFEIPVLAALGARSGAYQAVVCLGAVIRGETAHFEYVAGTAANGLMQLSIDTGVPIIFGILTTETAEQALARCGIKGGNKGREAASTALSMIKAVKKIKELDRK